MSGSIKNVAVIGVSCLQYNYVKHETRDSYVILTGYATP